MSLESVMPSNPGGGREQGMGSGSLAQRTLPPFPLPLLLPTVSEKGLRKEAAQETEAKGSGLGYRVCV